MHVHGGDRVPVLVLGAGCARGGDRVPGAGAGWRMTAIWDLIPQIAKLWGSYFISNNNELPARVFQSWVPVLVLVL